MRRDLHDLWVIAATVMACGSLLLLPELQWLSGITSLIMVLLLPGYAIVRALFPLLGVDSALRVVMVIALSMSATIFVGLFLGWLGIGFSPRPWLVSLGGVTCLASVMSYFQRRRASTRAIEVRVKAIPVRLVLLLGVSALVVWLAYGFVVDGAVEHRQSGLVRELWVTRGTRVPDSFALGITTTSSQPEYFDVRLMSGAIEVGYWSGIEVDRERPWQVELDSSDFQLGGLQPIEARLYLQGDEAILRRVALGVH